MERTLSSRESIKGKPLSSKVVVIGRLLPSTFSAVTSNLRCVMRVETLPHLSCPVLISCHRHPGLTDYGEGMFLAVPSQEVTAASSKAVHGFIKSVNEVIPKEAASGHRRTVTSFFCAEGP